MTELEKLEQQKKKKVRQESQESQVIKPRINCIDNRQNNKLNTQKLEIPNMEKLFDKELQKVLESYDNIFINHIKDYYYDGQIPDKILENMKLKLKQNKIKIFN
jgi:hypothetical protein